MADSSHAPYTSFREGPETGIYQTQRGELLWAMDIAEQPPHRGHPAGAHLIVRAYAGGFRGEVRVGACGREFTCGTHPRGWWSTKPGSLPLARHAIHCGASIAMPPAGEGG